MLHLMAGWWGFMIMLVPNSTQEKHTWASKLVAGAKEKSNSVFFASYKSTPCGPAGAILAMHKYEKPAQL